MLVAASYIFYGVANPWYCLLLLFSTLVDFHAAQKIAESSSLSKKKAWLFVSVILNLGVLALFKYGDFGIAYVNSLFLYGGISSLPYLNWVLPVGISFYTFQTISYSVDVYREKIPPCRDFLSFALYVAYFPQLVAGPIERANRLLPQLKEKQFPSQEDWESGWERVLWGLFKKLVLADRLALMVNEVYASPVSASSPELIVATMAFTLQLYLDFSAYTDIALGVARMMGIRLRENFNFPYRATNPFDFWSRWHISLSEWFRDYVYLPLQHAYPRLTLWNLLATMLLLGFWHGARVNFLIFGLLSGLWILLYLGANRLFRKRKQGELFGSSLISRILGVGLAFLMINFIMVFFRTETVHQAFLVIIGIFTHDWSWSFQYNITAILLFFVLFFHWYPFSLKKEDKDLSSFPVLRGVFWGLLFLFLLYFSVDTSERFIYFQF